MEETIFESAIEAFEFCNEENDCCDLIREEYYQSLEEIVDDFFEIREEYFPEITDEVLSKHAVSFGHDLYLTCDGHGAGFWDGDWNNILSQKTIDELCKWCDGHRLSW